MFEGDYYKNPKIDIYRFLNADNNAWSIMVLKNLGIIIENKLYTQHEFECLRVDISEYYENENNLPKNVTKLQYKKLRELFDKIMHDLE